MMSFPAVDVTAMVVGDAWKNLRVRQEVVGFLMMTQAFWAAIWRTRMSEWKNK